MAKASIHDVAKYIHSALGKETITQMSLYKLLWFCQGWHYAEIGELLFKEKFVAWKHGPIPLTLWRIYRGNIHLEASDFSGDTKNISDESKAVIDTVLDYYGKLSSSVLVKLSHNCTPWIEAYKIAQRRGTFQRIPNKAIKKYFKELKNRAIQKEYA